MAAADFRKRLEPLPINFDTLEADLANPDFEFPSEIDWSVLDRIYYTDWNDQEFEKLLEIGKYGERPGLPEIQPHALALLNWWTGSSVLRYPPTTMIYIMSGIRLPGRKDYLITDNFFDSSANGKTPTPPPPYVTFLPPNGEAPVSSDWTKGMEAFLAIDLETSSEHQKSLFQKALNLLGFLVLILVRLVTTEEDSVAKFIYHRARATFASFWPMYGNVSGTHIPPPHSASMRSLREYIKKEDSRGIYVLLAIVGSFYQANKVNDRNKSAITNILRAACLLSLQQIGVLEFLQQASRLFNVRLTLIMEHIDRQGDHMQMNKNIIRCMKKNMYSRLSRPVQITFPWACLLDRDSDMSDLSVSRDPEYAEILLNLIRMRDRSYYYPEIALQDFKKENCERVAATIFKNLLETN